MSFDERLKKIAPILNYKNPKLIKNILVDEGIEDETILDASTTTEDDLVEILMTLGGTKKLKAKMCASILKGKDPHEKDSGIIELPNKKSESSVIADLIKANRPVTQWSDEEVLKGYIESDGDDLEAELQRRSKNRPFIILNKNSERQEIDVDDSLFMLKRARKEEIPSSMTTGDGRFVKIFKISQYSKENRIHHESPLRPGVILFDGYCNASKQNFSNVSEGAKKMLRLIRNDLGEQTRMEESHLVEVAKKEGLDGLGRKFPEIHDNYMKLAMTDSLPSLKTLIPMDTKSDPFYEKESNHRTF